MRKGLELYSPEWYARTNATQRRHYAIICTPAWRKKKNERVRRNRWRSREDGFIILRALREIQGSVS